MFIFGLMSEILVKIYYGVHVDRSYSIKEVVDTEAKTDMDMDMEETISK